MVENETFYIGKSRCIAKNLFEWERLGQKKDILGHFMGWTMGADQISDGNEI